jgi:hypothetical protein
VPVIMSGVTAGDDGGSNDSEYLTVAIDRDGVIVLLSATPETCLDSPAHYNRLRDARTVMRISRAAAHAAGLAEGRRITFGAAPPQAGDARRERRR